MKRGELAKRTECNIETVRYYEKAGLLADPPRTAKGYRIYDESHEKTLRFILQSRKLGFTVEEVRDLLTLVSGGNYTCDEILEKTQAHLKSVQARITDLQRLESTLLKTIAKCKGGNTPDCAIVEALGEKN